MSDLSMPSPQVEEIIDLFMMVGEHVPNSVREKIRSAVLDLCPDEVGAFGFVDEIALIENGMLSQFMVLGRVPEPVVSDGGVSWEPHLAQVKWFSGDDLASAYSAVDEWRDEMYREAYKQAGIREAV